MLADRTDEGMDAMIPDHFLLPIHKLAGTSFIVLAVAVFMLTASPETQARDGGCSIEDATINFGSLSALSPGWHPGTGEINVRCHNDGGARTSFTVAVGLSHETNLNSAMTPGEGPLRVKFFEDPAHRVPWGAMGGGEGRHVNIAVEAMSDATLRLPVYALVLVSQGARAGDYSGRIPVTILYR